MNPIMSDSNSEAITTLKREALNSRPGILPPGKSMQSLIGHTVVNISEVHLTKHQVEALETGLTFCPPRTPKQINNMV